MKVDHMRWWAISVLSSHDTIFFKTCVWGQKNLILILQWKKFRQHFLLTSLLYCSLGKSVFQFYQGFNSFACLYFRQPQSSSSKQPADPDSDPAVLYTQLNLLPWASDVFLLLSEDLDLVRSQGRRWPWFVIAICLQSRVYTMDFTGGWSAAA